MKKFAVLIDADNAQVDSIKKVLGKVSSYGKAIIRRAYGDWMGIGSGWKEALSSYAIQPIQQCRHVKGKNASDIALVIDAMDILHGGMVDGFFLVASDSDYTRLAVRIREAGLSVYGFGKKDTPKPFVAACDAFVYIDHDLPEADGSQSVLLEELLTAVLASAKKTEGWLGLAALGNLLVKADPAFNPRRYGFGKLSELVAAQPYLETCVLPESGILVRIKEAA